MANEKILIIEDDDALMTLLEERLRFHGYQVLGASDGEEGLAMAYQHGPKVIICDIMMPVKNGFQVCKELRAKGMDVGFIFLTARESSEDQLDGFRCGADDYITKPFDPLVLEAKVTALLQRGRSSSPRSLNGHE